ncbi:hypothetical protein D7Y13_11485 [Corallococcus praedator]|uniref:Uncharacterized protein n=1 Tax=Corallococcus praedator TaxID=2316724 RepID=A0ABX9QL65_9BACT|nr:MULTISPECIES: hypothetical protein [Corallococcus]RKH31530.1 hypothetical protein D7X75_19135 [Corallococcus sp. CA031C]RKI11174.1 hypothetical protein D7Y13_11485 [Corallococcus praedator]
MRLTVKDTPHPFATAVKRLETREGWGITYEEALTAPAPDGAIDLTYTVTEATRKDAKLQEKVLNQLIAQQAGKAAPRFRLRSAGGLWHITPVQGSPLDTPITLPRMERPLGEVLQALCAEVTKQGGTPLELGSTTGLRLETPITLEATLQEPARTVLARVLNSDPRRAAWTLRAQEPEKKYVLSPHRIFRLAGDTPPPSTPPAEAPKPRPSGG